MAGLVNYQDVSIVSRVLIGRDTGTISLFAFDEGQGLSEHTAPFDALVQMLEGEMEIWIDGKPLNVEVGHLLLMPVNHRHALKAVTRSKMLLTSVVAIPSSRANRSFFQMITISQIGERFQ